MLLSKLVGERTKENPSDATIRSHALLVRAGFIKLVANGIWALAMPARRICKKIENIIREEMDAVEGQEVSFPVVMPRELWEESGRYSSIGDEMVRFKDRNQKDLVLGMTHEEAAVYLCRNWVSSYQQLPFMIYQLQTKFRDEARSRGGLIRVREFVMKDAYSFHMSQEGLEEYYQRMYDAYSRIFKRIGMKKVAVVKSDSGMMGGNIAHEYMLLTPSGEDTIVLCSSCDYKANIEIAASVREPNRDDISSELEEVFTADKIQIDEVSELLKVPAHKTIKAVTYENRYSGEIIVAFIRGDLEINEAKLKKLVGKDIVPASLQDSQDVFAGNIGPIGLTDKVKVFFDTSLKEANNMVGGANKPEYHITGIDVSRDLKGVRFDDISKVRENEKCPVCGHELNLENGIEVGNIFQLGDKFTKGMNLTVLNREGKAQHPIMGCYGIGIGRALSSVAEESNDEYGLIWPMSIAPWHVYLCPLRLDDPLVKENAYKLYRELEEQGVEVLFDDRDTSAGVKFSDCDLMGIPLRVVISPRSLKNNQAEVQSRTKDFNKNINLSDVTSEIKKIISNSIL